MKALIHLIKKNKMMVGLGCGILLCILGMMLSSGSGKTSNNTETDVEHDKEFQITETAEPDAEDEIPIHYEEDDDYVGYNYIINPQMLDEHGIYVIHIQDIPDEINRVLQEDGYSGEQLKVKNVRQSGTKIKFSVVVISDRTERECEYSLRFGTFSIK